MSQSLTAVFIFAQVLTIFFVLLQQRIVIICIPSLPLLSQIVFSYLPRFAGNFSFVRHNFSSAEVQRILDTRISGWRKIMQIALVSLKLARNMKNFDRETFFFTFLHRLQKWSTAKFLLWTFFGGKSRYKVEVCL